MRARIEVVGRHWLWVGSITSDGYGTYGGAGFNWQAHRLVWVLLGGELPEDLHHDGCPHKNCVRPGCLAPLTKAEHTKSHAHDNERTECVNGHAFTEANTYWRTDRKGNRSRVCRLCKAERQRKRYAANPKSEIRARTERRRRARA